MPSASPDAAPLARFELGGDRQLEPGEIFEIAAKARAAGYRIDKAELKRATGFEIAQSAGYPDPD